MSNLFEYKKNYAIKEYTTKKGITKYMFQIYIGINPETSKKSTTTRRGFKTPALANAEYRKIEASVRNDSFVFSTAYSSPSQLTFNDVYLRWFTESYRNTVQSSTIYKTKQMFDVHILPAIGNMKINAITSDVLQPVVNSWANKYTKLNILSRYAKRVFDFAFTLKLIIENPFDHIMFPKRQVTNLVKDQSNNFFSSLELEKFTRYLLNNSNKDNTGSIDFTHATFLLVLAYTGMRKGELLALEWNDINFDDSTIDIKRTLAMVEGGKLAVQPPKWLSYRIIDLNNLILNLLKTYHEYSSESILVFPNDKNTWRNLSKPNTWIKSVINQGISDFNATYIQTNDDYYKIFVHQITPHGLRHTHATWLFEKDSTITPKSVQERLGHKNISVTLDIYTHVTSNQKEKLKSALDIDF
ncbi:integrase [Dellaglioa algida DSM 15638]|uniref:Integrase n=1 Tax=Dellaglioa algida DSM 15638 TaxID=1423719 RepID=A0A0R1HL44_9LACO|nr:integrase [Dellaglioa algida DSM 15638]